MLDPDEPAPFEAFREDGRSPMVLLCDHASRRMPRRLGDLGLDAASLEDHIAWDIGARSVAELLSERFDAPLVASGYSRLAIDCNRPIEVASSIPENTCGVPVPGNVGLDEEARRARQDALFWPYHRAVEALLRRREDAGRPSIIVSIHSFTSSLHGKARPWHFSVLYGKDPRFAHALIAALSASGELVVGDNEPYQVSEGTDYGVPVYAERAGRPGALVEVRNDLLRTDASIARMARLLGDALEAIVQGRSAPRSTPPGDAPGP